jgi:large conductance mechanosensitive channel
VKSILDEFKAFALRGNVIELAVAVILGLAFNSVIQALVGGILLPFVAAIFGKPNFDALTFKVGEGVIRYGSFLTAVATFVLIALALFVVIKAFNQITRPRGEAPEPPKTRDCPYCLTAIPVRARVCSACTSPVEPAAG